MTRVAYRVRSYDYVREHATLRDALGEAERLRARGLPADLTVVQVRL